jgi:hypothetical protein
MNLAKEVVVVTIPSSDTLKPNSVKNLTMMLYVLIINT